MKKIIFTIILVIFFALSLSLINNGSVQAEWVCDGFDCSFEERCQRDIICVDMDGDDYAEYCDEGPETCGTVEICTPICYDDGSGGGASGGGGNSGGGGSSMCEDWIPGCADCTDPNCFFNTSTGGNTGVTSTNPNIPSWEPGKNTIDENGNVFAPDGTPIGTADGDWWCSVDGTMCYAVIDGQTYNITAQDPSGGTSAPEDPGGEYELPPECADNGCQPELGENCLTCPSVCGACPPSDCPTGFCSGIVLEGYYSYKTCASNLTQCLEKPVGKTCEQTCADAGLPFLEARGMENSCLGLPVRMSCLCGYRTGYCIIPSPPPPNTPPAVTNLLETPNYLCDNIALQYIISWDEIVDQESKQIQVSTDSIWTDDNNYNLTGGASNGFTVFYGGVEEVDGNVYDIPLVYNEDYYYRVRVWDTGGLVSDWAYDSFSTPPAMAPTPEFSFDPTRAAVGDTVAFQDQSGIVSSRRWTFQDATPATSTSSTPSVVFNLSGKKNVTLEVTGNGLTCSITKQIPISMFSYKWKEIMPW